MAKGHETAGVGFPRVPGDLPQDYPEASPPGPAWTIYHYRERRSYWHFTDPATWDEAIQRDYDPEGLTVAERQARGQGALTMTGVALPVIASTD